MTLELFRKMLSNWYELYVTKVESMGRVGETAVFFGAMESCVGLCENPNKLEISIIKANTNFFPMRLNLAVKIVKKRK